MAMVKRMKKNQKLWLVAVIVVCIGVILLGGFRYVSSLRRDLTDQAVLNVLTVTQQQQQAFDNFISGDRERLHSFAEYFSQNGSESTRTIRQQLTVFCEVDASYSVINLDTGFFCSNKTNEIYQLGVEELETYRALFGSGVRDPYTGLYSGEMMFGYYERFTFADGVPGLIQKSYDRSKISEEFSLSFYNDRGFAYVVNREGEILLRSVGMIGDRFYDNIFDVLTGTYGKQEDIDGFKEALSHQSVGSMVFSGEMGAFVYTYVPVENVDEWYLVSIVPMAAITEETDQILMDSQIAFVLLMVVLAVCAVFVLMIWQTHRDIMEKDQEIEYQKQLFEIFSTYLANNSDDVYMMLDLGKDLAEYVSPSVERVLGISAEEVIPALQSYDWSGCAPGEEISFEKLAGLKPGESLETRRTEWINPKTGEQKWFRISAYCTLVQGRSRMVLYISDRTQERRTQDTLSEALNIAQVANHAKSAFLSSVSHDIRTPMNAIIGFVSLLQEDADKPDLVRDYTRRIDAASQHLLGLINDVLDMNKIESGSATLNISEMDLAGVIEEINTIIRPQTRAKGQEFEIYVSPFAHEHLMGDKLRINQVLINLLSNSVKYTPEGGEIRMRVEELPQVVDEYSRIRFTISDNGLGMSEEYQQVMFNPFTREETSATRGIQGTGLGMAITKSLVDLMGGTIRVQSRLGEGSTFEVELELYIQKREDDSSFWTDHNVVRMIVADDEEEVCLSVVKTMEKTGVITDYSTDGRQAIEMMRQAREAGHPYDLILLDWKMPDMSGLQTARLIRKHYSEKIPILLFTAYDWGDIEEEAREIGVSHFMPKPFFISTFKDAIRRVMGSMKPDEVEEDNVVEGKHFLVVDDIEVNRMILVKILQTLGAVCSVAGDGQEAVEKFENSRPGEYDVILMDVQMPVMDGYTATRAIRAGSHPEAGTVPIIAMTANAFVDDVRDAIESGMSAHVAKPIQIDKLKAAIRQVLGKKKAQDEATGRERGFEA